MLRSMARMYPRERMFRALEARHLQNCGCTFLNPPWTALLSNKALLPALWKRYPGYPNLLSAGYPKIFQEFADHRIDDVTASIGIWIVGDRFSALTVRESPDPIVRSTSPLVPYVIRKTRILRDHRKWL
nr:glutathionylspermidine synthase family protein [Gluconobacter frateurii]